MIAWPQWRNLWMNLILLGKGSFNSRQQKSRLLESLNIDRSVCCVAKISWNNYLIWNPIKPQPQAGHLAQSRRPRNTADHLSRLATLELRPPTLTLSVPLSVLISPLSDCQSVKAATSGLLSQLRQLYATPDLFVLFSWQSVAWPGQTIWPNIVTPHLVNSLLPEKRINLWLISIMNGLILPLSTVYTIIYIG